MIINADWSYIPNKITHIGGWDSPTHIETPPAQWITSSTYTPITLDSSTPTSGKEKDSDMRGLYRVYIVDPETDEVIEPYGKPFVAKNEDNAQLKAVQKAGDQLLKDIDEYDIISYCLGDVRPRKTVQEVKVVDG